jgi:riboflavin kinase/FMN adenylyltransferase
MSSPDIVSQSLEAIPIEIGHSSIHLAIGIFDGVHRGHQAILQQTRRLADEQGGHAVVLTFWPHPSHLLRPQKATPMIIPKEARVELLQEYKMDHIIVQSFTEEFADLSATIFPSWLKDRLPTLTTISVGQGFRFGKDRHGDAEFLIEEGAKLDIAVHPVTRIDLNGEALSSTRIRKNLQDGKLPKANEMLGYNWFASGNIIPGQAIGRTLGFPTMNLDWTPELSLPQGVYACKTRPVGDMDQPLLPAVANYGIRPTVDPGTDPKPRLEIHLLDPAEIPNWSTAHVEFIQYLRAEKKFPSKEELVKQIQLDVKETKNLFNL